VTELSGRCLRNDEDLGFDAQTTCETRQMTLAFEYFAFVAIALLGWLAWLLLFERGTSYRTSDPLEQLNEDDRFRLLATLIATPVQPIESLELLREGSSMYERQLAAIRGATCSVHLEAYIFRPGQYAAAYLRALMERAHAGVPVRVIIDAIGSFQTPRGYFRANATALEQPYTPQPAGSRWNVRVYRRGRCS